MRTTLDGTIMLTERLLQLASVKGKEQGIGPSWPSIFRTSCKTAAFRGLPGRAVKNIDLGYEGERSAVMIAGDGVLLAELCANLLDNAIRYTPANGTVTLSLRRDGEGVVMEVEDSGPGIEDDQIQQALLPFQRRKMSGITRCGSRAGAGDGYCPTASQSPAAAAQRNAGRPESQTAFSGRGAGSLRAGLSGLMFCGSRRSDRSGANLAVSPGHTPETRR